MKTKFFSENYKVTSYLVNLRGRAGLYTMLSFIQDVGWLHAKELDIKLGENLGWVFTRQKLEMTSWPSWNESVTLKTWLRPPDGFFLYRDYEISLSGQVIGHCTSTFTVMDMTTRKLAQQDWSDYQNIWHASQTLGITPKKIVSRDSLVTKAQFQVRNSDIDLNFHVNNTKYAQWILDAIPIENLRAGAFLKSYEVNFLAESRISDQILVQADDVDLKSQSGTSIVHFQGSRLSDSKTVFTAELGVVV